MSDLTHHDAYGTVSVAQLRAYRRHNISTSDHELLCEYFGAGARQRITAFVIEHGDLAPAIAFARMCRSAQI